MSLIQNLIKPTSLSRWKIQNLDYNWYFALSVAGGFIGADYLYLGSPLGAIGKFVFNLSTFGYWWFYDAINAAVAQDQIRLYGPTTPVLGSTGLAAGRFRDKKHPIGAPERLEKHLNFIIYGLVLVAFGIFGGDSFLMGNFFSGVIRLFSFISMIGIPIAGFWWAMNMYYYFLDTGACIDQNWDYFGAAKGAKSGPECPSIFMSVTIWLLKTIQGIIWMIPGIGPLISMVLDRLITGLSKAYGMVTDEIDTATETIESLKGIAKNPPLNVKELQKAKIEQELAGPECELTEEERTPMTEEEVKAATAAAKAGAAAMAGGALLSESSTPLIAGFFALTIGFIIVSSIVLSLRRSKQNAATTVPVKPGSEETDDPPHPGNTRDPAPVQ